MKLLSLKLQDFQGLRTFELDADGRNVSVYGTNGTGKTTIANAISWVLFEKPYTGEKNYSPKTTDADGQELHHLDHRAELVLEKDDGSRITLAKSYHEVWKKKRGSAMEEFSGHVTDAFIDGVPVSTSEYKRTMEAMFPAEKAKILTDPRYFPKAMHWEQRRATLLEMCGDLSDAEVIGQRDELSGLWEYLRKPGSTDQFYTVAEFLRIAASRKAEVNRELTILPARIDETNQAIPDISDLPPEETLEATIERLEADKMSLMERASAMTVDEQTQVLRRQVAEMNADIAQAKAEYFQAYELRNRTANEAVTEIAAELSKINAAIMIDHQKVHELEETIQATEKQREELLQQHHAVKGRVWQGDTVCASCGQPLPADMVEQAKARFNQQRSRELGEINARGQQCSATVIEGLQAQLDEADEALLLDENRREDLIAELNAAQSAVETVPPFEQTTEYQTMAARRDAMSAQIEDGQNTMAEQKAQLQAQINALTAELNRAQDARMLYATAAKRRARIAELEAQEKELAKEYERFDRGVFLCEEFTRAKVQMLDERINSRFHAVRFRLFKTQINGGLQDCCDVLCPTSSGLTPYDSANNAAQINAGIEIAAALGNHWGLTMPIIIDNAESVVDLIETEAQTVRLVVSKPDKRLRTEFDDESSNHLGVA